MREQIIDCLFRRMGEDPSIFFLSADMGINLIERFDDVYPNRFANVGIAEQNMISVAAGLANVGYRPFAYTISNFLIHRCFEQIRNDIALHEYPITLLGTSTGYDNAPLGPTHHVVDEWGALKSIPGIDIYCPSSVKYASFLIDHLLQRGKPAYVRIPKGAHVEPDSAEHIVKIHGDADEVIFVSYGNALRSCLDARKHDSRFSVLILNRLHPLDEKVLLDALSPHRRIIVVEDHFPHTGLYASLCEFFLRHSMAGRLESVAPNKYVFDVGSSPDYFFKKFGFDVESLLKLVES
jgi:transketolase